MKNDEIGASGRDTDTTSSLDNDESDFSFYDQSSDCFVDDKKVADVCSDIPIRNSRNFLGPTDRAKNSDVLVDFCHDDSLS